MGRCSKAVILGCLVSCVALAHWRDSLVSNARADNEQTLTVSSKVPPMDGVSRAYLVVGDSTNITAVAPLTYVEPPEGKDATLIGRLRIPSEHGMLGLLFSMMNTAGEVRSVYREYKAEELPMVTRLSTSQLRDRFVERRGALRQLQASVSALEARLTTLQEDADAIANVNKLVNAEDELRETKASLERVKAAQDAVQSRVALLRSRPQPLNAQRRQADLVRQLAEFSTALAKTESGAFKRMQSASTDLQSKLRDIEETKDEHVGLLEEELAGVKRARKESGAR